MSETAKTQVAAGFAWNYYFGYLKIMLPGMKGMLAMAQGDEYQIDGEDIREKLSSHKLFIVIPKNCYTYNSFTQVDERITFKCSMPPIKKTRGGVQERIYKNTVWEIKTSYDKEPLYVLMEYAKPCLTMYEMTRAVPSFTKSDMDSQSKEFVLKLQSILHQDVYCKDKYQLVLYDGKGCLEDHAHFKILFIHFHTHICNII